MKIRLSIAIAVVAVVATLGAYARWGPFWPRSNSQAADAEQPTSAPEEARTKVVLTPEKFCAARLSYAQATLRPLQSVRTVPGKIEYRSVHSVEIKAPVDLVVEKVRVKPGTIVETGTRLADLTSPEIGMARADVEKAESELKIANQALEWADEITRNLNELLVFLREIPQSKDIEKSFDDKLLGEHRNKVLLAYSQYELAERNLAAAEKGYSAGVTPDRTLREREAARQMARDHYLSICEQSRFDARQARERALQNQKYARRLVDVNRRKLRTLLGEYSEISPSGDSSPENGLELTRFYLIAPFAGTVEQRMAADSQRVAEGTPLFMVANTDILEVHADIFEGTWQAVSLSERPEKQMLKVSVPALGEDHEFDAKVDYVGRAFDAQTRAIPLVALLDNSLHQFKPGMFAWIKIPSGTSEAELVVPAAAIGTHERQDFVFVEDEQDPRTFHRVDVVVGTRTPDWVTITAGLTTRARVVVEGAFLLKNELLLEPEEE
jgi:cobalt-zinc-cadmium efflux system membrane fusion protein